jgi:SAM-dependent methyltransferase
MARQNAWSSTVFGGAGAVAAVRWSPPKCGVARVFVARSSRDSSRDVGRPNHGVADRVRTSTGPPRMSPVGEGAAAYHWRMGEDWPIDEVFDKDYLHFYEARLAEDTTDDDALLVWNLLGLRAGVTVLDLACGHGRIANRLAGMGARVTGLDATARFLGLARADARERGVHVDYVRGDMRWLPWSGRFDGVVSWFTSYGYFDDDQNRAVLAEVYQALRPGGRFLIELNHKDGLLPHWVPATVTEVGDGILIDQREFDPLTGRSNARRTIIRDGRVRHSFFFVRMFSFTELRDWLDDAGFPTVHGYAGDGFGLSAASRRMILLADK